MPTPRAPPVSPRERVGSGDEIGTRWGEASLVPRPPPFFVLRFSFGIIHGSGRARKRGRPGNTYHVNDVWWTRGGRRGGGVHVQITY